MPSYFNQNHGSLQKELKEQSLNSKVVRLSLSPSPFSSFTMLTSAVMVISFSPSKLNSYPPEQAWVPAPWSLGSRNSRQLASSSVSLSTRGMYSVLLPTSGTWEEIRYHHCTKILLYFASTMCTQMVEDGENIKSIMSDMFG